MVEQRFFARGRAARRGEAIAWSISGFALALLVAGAIAIGDGPAGAWTTVYLIERSLSLDNVFLFSLLLAYFAVPPELRGRVIAIGIVGALVLRGLAIVAGHALVEAAEAVVFVFGALLLYVADIAFAVDSVPAALAVTRVGLKILLADVVPIGDVASLAVIALLLAGGVGASLLADRLDPPEPVELAARKPPRCPPGLIRTQ